MSNMENEDPWAWMQPYDVRRFGEVIMDSKEQERWCRAVLLGGLPFMWRKAEVARNLIATASNCAKATRCSSSANASNPAASSTTCAIGSGHVGEIKVFDITDEARDNYIAKRRGRGGQLATWAWTYTRDIPDGNFDCAVCLQGVQHTDRRGAASDETRGRNIVLAEIAYSPETRMKIGLDMHIEYVFDNLLSRVGWRLEQFPYYSPQDLASAFKGLVIDPDYFVWKGIEIFWGRKP
ncbi:MAG: hypothetical protein WBW99_20995 [Pseudolabrys sp.]